MTDRLKTATDFVNLVKTFEGITTKTELLEFAKKITAWIEQIDSRNLKEFKAVHAVLAELTKETTDKADTALEDVKLEVSKQMSNFMKLCEAKLNAIKEGSDGEKGDKGDKGDAPTAQELLSLMKPLIPAPIAGSPDTGKEIVDKINDLPTDDDDLKIDVKHIKGLDKLIKQTQKLQPMGGGTSARDLFKAIDISSQLDGVTATFNIQAIYMILSVDLSSFPYGALRETVDYTYTPTSITFTSQIDPATQLASGQSCIIKAILA